MATPNRSERGHRAFKEGQRRNNPKNGDTTIKEGTKFVFKDGKWVKASKPTTTPGRSRRGAAAATRPAPKSKVANYSDAQGNTYDGKTGRLKKSASKPNVADYSDAQGNVYDGNTGRLKSSSKPSPKASKPPAPEPKPTATKPAAKAPSSSSKTSSRNVGPVASGDEYARNKNPKKYNPLMQKTFGYQTGDAPDQRAKKTASKKPDVGYKPSTKVSKNYADKKPSNNTSNAYDRGVNLNPAKPASPNEKKKKSASQNLAEAIRKRRTNT